MGEIRKHIYFSASPETIWKILMDVQSTPQWVAGVTESTILKPSSGAGLCWREIWEFMNQKIQVDHEMISCEPHVKAEIRSKLPLGASMEKLMEIQTSNEKTVLALSLTWNLGMVGSMIGEDAVQEVMDQNLEKTAQNWKNLAEAKV